MQNWQQRVVVVVAAVDAVAAEVVLEAKMYRRHARRVQAVAVDAAGDAAGVVRLSLRECYGTTPFLSHSFHDTAT